MATNLVSLVMEFLTPDMIGRIATALSLDRNSAQTAIGAGVPGFWPDSAASPCNLVEGKGWSIPPSGPPARSETLPACLALGGRPRSSRRDHRCSRHCLAGIRPRWSVHLPAASGSLLGLLAPAVMGTIAKQQGAQSLSASGIAGLLASQKDNIAAALPSGFGNLLGGTGLLDSLGGAARTVTGAGTEAARTATTAARTVADTSRRAAGATSSAWPNWLYWVIPAVAIAALLIYLLARPAEQVAQQGVPYRTEPDGWRSRRGQTGYR